MAMITGGGPQDEMPVTATAAITMTTTSMATDTIQDEDSMAAFRRNKRLLSDDAESAERVRLENRQRKKKWREANEDRNKDNDLRCRVTKRANKLFGNDLSERKGAWIECEFKRRQSKRQEKEKKKVVDGVDEAASLIDAINMSQFQETLLSSLKTHLKPYGDDEDARTTFLKAMTAITSNASAMKSFFQQLGFVPGDASNTMTTLTRASVTPNPQSTQQHTSTYNSSPASMSDDQKGLGFPTS